MNRKRFFGEIGIFLVVLTTLALPPVVPAGVTINFEELPNEGGITRLRFSFQENS
jgi:hypothetical protein